MVGLGSHKREAWFPNQLCHDGSTIIAWTKGEGEEGYGSSMKVGRHPHSIDGRLAHPVALLEGDWLEESRVNGEDGFLETKGSAEGRNLQFLDVTIHVGHEDNLITIRLPGGDSSQYQGHGRMPSWGAGVILTE